MSELGLRPPPGVLLGLKAVSLVLEGETRLYERLARTIQIAAQRR